MVSELWYRLCPAGDLSAPELQPYRGLSERCARPSEGVSVVEGRILFRRVLEGRAKLVSVLADVRKRASVVADLEARGYTLVTAAGAPNALSVWLAAPEQLAEILGFRFHRGVLALVTPPPWSDDAVLGSPGRARLLVGLERVADPENVGAAFRQARALGADAMVLDAHSADPHYRRAIRVSMGATLAMPWLRRPSAALFSALRRAGYEVIGASPGGAPIRATSAAWGPRTALFFGNEGAGLSEDALSAVDRSVAIEMAPGSDSLNVASTVAVLAFLHGQWHPRGAGRAD